MRFLVAALVVMALGGQPAADRRVTIASDGWELAGTFRMPEGAAPAPAVLLLNGAARDRRAYVALANDLAARGVASLRLDLRGEGESTNLGRFEPGVNNQILDGADRDVAAALQWLRAQDGIDDGRIGVLGASYSGEAMAAAARAGSAAAAYVALSPGNFSDTSTRGIDASGVPWWFIASADERFAQSVVQAVPAISRRARVTIVPGNAHASDILSPHFLLNAEIADWFAARLRGIVAPPLWGGLEPGAWRAGFRTVTVDRPAGALRIDLWFPAGAASASPMRYAEYLAASDDLRVGAQGFPRDRAALPPTLAAAIAGSPDAIPADVLDAILDSPMAARADAPPAAGTFPLVLWAPRFGTTAMQAPLSEFLASHGFIVAAARPLGGVKGPFELTGPAAKRAELAARVIDMRDALAALARMPSVDASSVAVLAWSYAGPIATAFQQTEPRVTFVAGLSTALFNTALFGDAAAPEALDPDKLTATYALFQEPREQRPEQAAILEKLRSSYLVEFPGAAHGSFNALEGFIPSLRGITTVQPFSKSGAETIVAYEATGVMLVRLLRHHLSSRQARPLRAVALTAGIAPGAALVR